ncbi:pre-mRNA cleavage complex 2 protein Pcf11 isoform X2 [Achroia grisella]|uniref:pre-mRNA cleavage complex 2 protein Pcf11 isoform X2 n=1 Tax=Achroia grisella TaxID=688607 RepID=UPI0027D2BC18|nr:pre-mRNA cleavage complex 2 protein Pcf11 isoform X2 [Achroia grisella]
MAKEIAEEYASSLADLTMNSKPLINMLTILAEENIEHAGVIVETVEKHLEKVHPDIKLPVLYLVDSIIKNVGRAYTQKFSQSIVNMFTRTFKQVDERVRSQMFKLRETWHDVFPATKLYQLDVKVNLIDPAWPIQAQPQQSNIHVNPNFLKKPMATTSVTTPPDEEEKMRNILAKKEQELLMLQRKKVEMELEQARKQLEMTEKSSTKVTTVIPPSTLPPSMPVALVNPVVAPVMSVAPDVANIPVKQRLGPPVNKLGRIAPVSGALAAARRDPRLARRPPPPAPTAPPPQLPIAPNVFDIKPLERVTKRKNVITIDVQPGSVARPRDPRRRDPRLESRDDRPRKEKSRDDHRPSKKSDDARKRNDVDEKSQKADPADDSIVDYFGKLPDLKKINKLPPIPKINRSEEGARDSPVPTKKRKELRAEKKQKREDAVKSSSSESSPEKKLRNKEARKKKERRADEEAEKPPEPEVIAFKELKNYHKERYMRRNKEKSESPEKLPTETQEDNAVQNKESSNVPEIDENKDVDLRVLHPVDVKPAVVSQKRPSTEMLPEVKAKKNKHDKFDILFGNEDVDLRQLPQVEELNVPPPQSVKDSPKAVSKMDEDIPSPHQSPKQKDWNEVKEKNDDTKKTPSKLDIAKAKLAEATKGKDRLGRPLLFNKSPSVERERRRTISSEDVDLRAENTNDFDTEDHKKTISIIMHQAKEQYSDGQLDKNQYNTLMYQVLQLNEKLKLKEAKQRESLEVSKRKLKAHTQDENNKVASPKSSPTDRNRFGDIDERITPVYMDTPPDSQQFRPQDSDMRMNINPMDGGEAPNSTGLLPLPPNMPPMFPPYIPTWRGQPRPRVEEYVPRRFRGVAPPFFRGKFDKRAMRPPFDPRPPCPLPTPTLGMCQGESPLLPYERTQSPPPLGAPGVVIPSTDYRVLEYIDQDPVKTIQIDGVSREIRFYGETAVIMMEWDDPREIKFLPGCRRVTFDNKDSVVLSFNEGYKQVEIDDQVFNIRFGAPTRELFINGRWYESFFGGQPIGTIIDGKPRLVQLEGPPPQVDIGKTKRTDLVAGKINLIVDATQMCPLYLDAKVQKFHISGHVFTVRFVDSLRTVLINEQPFKIEFGELPKPITIGNKKFFIRFSALPRNIKAGHVQIANMEGARVEPFVQPTLGFKDIHDQNSMETDQDVVQRPVKTPSPEVNSDNNTQGLDMLASVMPSSIAPASASEYSLAEPLFAKADKIPGLDTPADEKPANPILPVLANINVNDLFAKLVATGIVHVNNDVKTETKEEVKEEVKPKPKEDKTKIHRVDLLRSDTLKVKQEALVWRLYGGMQCSSCGARFPPEHTVRYSQHLDWHFRQNRRQRDSARRAHSRHWHYDLSDWLQYEELEDLEEREKSWFETGGAEGEAAIEGLFTEPAEEAPSVAAGAPQDQHCALCGDLFHQFYNEDKEEWHLRNSVRHNDNNYHPLCFEDYKASLTKEEPVQDSKEIVTDITKVEEAIEIKDVDDIMSQSDNESVVEVVEPDDKEMSEPVEIMDDETEAPQPEAEEDDGDEDDVVLKAEPVEHVDVDDDDTDDETVAERQRLDSLAAIDFANVKVKIEPIDPDDEPIITAEESIPTTVDTTHVTVMSSIDGNVQLDATTAPVASLLGGIRINISKTIPSFVTNIQDDKLLEDISMDDEPLPPGEEPELEYTLKPTLEGVEFVRKPPVNKGSELSGLCSIM